MRSLCERGLCFIVLGRASFDSYQVPYLVRYYTAQPFGVAPNAFWSKVVVVLVLLGKSIQIDLQPFFVVLFNNLVCRLFIY